MVNLVQFSKAPSKLKTVLNKVMMKYNNLGKVVGITARLL